MLTGMFESGADSYGPDAAKFRFVITEISAVEKSVSEASAPSKTTTR